LTAATNDNGTVFGECGKFATAFVIIDDFDVFVAVQFAAIDVVHVERKEPIAPLEDKRLCHDGLGFKSHEWTDRHASL
jgi:hypothetical protein